jgi:hypothetical protein
MGRVVAQGVVVRGDIDGNLMVEGAAADVVDLGDNIGSVVSAGLAVLGIGEELEDEAILDSEPLVVGVGVVPGAAEAESCLGAVLDSKVLAFGRI